MDNQISFTDIEYSERKKVTKREEFLKQMEAIIPWENWVKIISPYYPKNKLGRKAIEIEKMLRMLLLQSWFNLSDEGVEEAIYDSYAMRSFMGIHFEEDEQVPDATTLCKFRKLLNENGIQAKLFAEVNELLERKGKMVHGGSILDATIIEAPRSRKNKEHSTDPEMHSVKKGTKYYFGMRVHMAVDPIHGYTHTVVTTAANEAEVKNAPKLLRKDDEVVYGDSGYLNMQKYVTDGIERTYKIIRQDGTFKRHYGDGLAYKEERKIEKQKSSIRSKVEYMFHIVKDIFKWRKAKYKGIYKNQCYAEILFASANLYMLARERKLVRA